MATPKAMVWICTDADGMTGTQDVMQDHGSDSMLNRGGPLGLFLILNYTAFEQHGGAEQAKVTSCRSIDNILPTQWPQKNIMTSGSC